MTFRLPALKRLLPILLMVAMSWAASAQNLKRGQQILFSAPDNQTASNTVPSLAPKPADLSPFINSIRQPPPDFSFTPKSQPLPQPQQTITPAQAEQLRQALNRQKNWTLLTPAEIMGVQTPEKIFGLVETNANQSLAERYFQRQEQADARTNAYIFSPEWNLANKERANSEANVSDANPKANEPMFSPAFGVQAVQENSGGQNVASSGWPNPFGVAPTTPGQTPEQLAEAEQFKKLLEPHSTTPAKSAAVSFSSPSASASSFSGSPTINSVAAPLTLAPGVGTPATLKPITGLAGQKDSLTQFEPEWKPQLPPWMSSGPQQVPERKF